jgi:hypothetical protein
MPPAIIAAAIGAAVSGITGGLQLSGAFTPSAPKVTPAQQAASVAQQPNALKATVANNAPNYQAEAEGGLSPGYIANQIGTSTGTGQNISGLQDLVKQYVGGGGGGGGGGTTFPQGTIGDSTTTAPDSKGLTDLTQYLQAA